MALKGKTKYGTTWIYGQGFDTAENAVARKNEISACTAYLYNKFEEDLKASDDANVALYNLTTKLIKGYIGNDFTFNIPSIEAIHKLDDVLNNFRELNSTSEKLSHQK